MAKKYLLGLDNGGTLIKAGLYDTEGNAVADAGRKAEMITGRGGIVERDMGELWRTNAQVIRDVIQKAGIDAGDILGLAVASHGNGAYFIDENGNPLMNGIYSNDTRAKDIVQGLYDSGAVDRMIPKTMQILWPGQTTAIIAWMRDHRPELLKKARWALSCDDYIRFCLTGEACGEITNMSGISGMDLSTREYSDEVLEELGIREYKHLLAPIKKSCDICGYVTEKAAAETGLKPGTPVAGGMFDISACAIANGVTDPSKLCVIAGTWSINEFLSSKPIISKDLFMTCIYCMDDYYLTMEGSMTSASNLEWMVKNFLHEEKVQMEGQGKSVYDAVNAMVASVEPEDSSIIFLPFLFGTNINANAKACFLGVSSWHEKKHILRAIYEGVVFSHMAHIEKLFSFGCRPETVRIAGGVAKSEVWVQMFADVLQLPVEVSGIAELGTLGVAMGAGVAVGVFPSLKEAAEAFTRIAFTCQPRTDKKNIYAQKYALYKKIIGSLDKIWGEFSF